MKYFNTKFLFTFLVALVMVFSIAACGGSDAGSDTGSDTGAEATEAPADAAATEAPAASGDIVAEFTFTNTGSEEICELYLSPTGQDAWGPDQLGGATIVAGDKYILKNIPAAVYDVKAVGCAGSEVTGQLDIHN